MVKIGKFKWVNRLLATSGGALLIVTGLLSLAAPAHAQTCADGGKCAIGDTGPGGGIVFMVPSTMGNRSKLTYEVALANWSGTPTDPTAVWCSGKGSNVSLGTGKAIGAGKSNTEKMVKHCKSSAAILARSYRAGGKSDWFLPSYGELKKVNSNTKTDGGWGAGAFYRSSSEGPDCVKTNENQRCIKVGQGAWDQNFYVDAAYGALGTDAKNTLLAVRPVRTF